MTHWNRFVLAGALLLPAVVPSTGFTRPLRDKTIGLCTRKPDFDKACAVIDPEIQALTAAPEKKRAGLGSKIAKRHGKSERIEVLIRYRDPAMVHVFRPLLKAKNWAIRARALYGLKMVGDSSVIPDAVNALNDKDPKVREMAANCLIHVATELPAALPKALEVEKDRFVRSSLEAAITVLKSGTKPYPANTEVLEGPEGAKRVQYQWVVKGASSFNKYDAKTLEVPTAATFDWPISWYEGSLFAPVPRKSFGGPKGHTGEDMAWFREGCSFYAIGDGIVRMRQGAGGDWGFLIAVEHKLKTGLYVTCVYGHAAWDVLVKEGDVVKKGQKLGTNGLSCAVENGGYGAHLHFGLSQGPFRRSGIERGQKIGLKFGEQTVPTPVLAYGYDAQKRDEFGFPALTLIVRYPDKSLHAVPGPKTAMGKQVGWMTGYKIGCVGWHEPKKFIEARLADVGDGAKKK